MKLLYLILLFFSIQVASAQKTIFAVNFNGGASSFRGASAVGSTQVYTGGPFCNCGPSPAQKFGAKNAFSYGGGLSIQREFKNRMLLGMEVGYEMLRTKMEITKYVLDDMVMNAGGKNVSYSQFLNLFPHIGYRIPVGKEVTFSLTGGADFGIGLDSYDKLFIPEYFKKATRTNTDYIPGLDFRPRLQFQVSYRKTGFNVSYSHGLTNWMGDWIGGSPEAYMKVIRLGVQYRLN